MTNPPMGYRLLPSSGVGPELEARASAAGRKLDFRLSVSFVLVDRNPSRGFMGGIQNRATGGFNPAPADATEHSTMDSTVTLDSPLDAHNRNA